MNYKRIYDSIINRAKERVPEGYVERHHIIPKCLGGSDDRSNLVALTPEEHFLCHVLLVKIYPEHPGLIYAVKMMSVGHKGKRTKRKLYGWLRRRFSEQRKLDSIGEGNTQFGTFWINKVGTLENKKIKKGSEIPEGWVAGKRHKFKSVCPVCGKSKNSTKSVCSLECNSKVRSEKFKNDFYEDTRNHLQKFVQSDYTSLNEYAKIEFDYSLVTLTKRIKKFFPTLGNNQGCQDIKKKILEVL